MADGMTLRQEVVEAEGGASKRVFPLEKPTRTDRKLWTESLKVLSSPRYKLIHPLGAYINTPHTPDEWFTNEERD